METMNEVLVEKFMNFLKVEKQEPSLPFLNQLIKSHQLRVKWETLTKIIDWEKGNQTGDFLPPIDMYIDRMTRLGTGGTCWTHAVGFHWLLTHLGFQVHYLYMDSGHLCLRVDLDQPYYVDVGYCAPLFQAYPLYESFKVENVREVFDYTVLNDTITVTRTPGPTKSLNLSPIQLVDVKPNIKASNNWATSPVLKDIQIFTYHNGVPTSIRNNTLKQYYETEKRETELTDEEMEQFITIDLGIDKNVYQEALRIYHSKKLN